MTKGATVPKLLVYLLMFLLLEPILRWAGVAVSGLYLVLLAGVGIALLVGATNRRRSGPQRAHSGFVPGYGHAPWPYGPPAQWPAWYGAPGYTPAAPLAYAPHLAPTTATPPRPQVQTAASPAVVADRDAVDAVSALWLDDPSAPHWIRDSR